jgi:hypothetical protein
LGQDRHRHVFRSARILIRALLTGLRSLFYPGRSRERDLPPSARAPRARQLMCNVP